MMHKRLEYDPLVFHNRIIGREKENLETKRSKWRLKDRIKTVCGGLLLCLNIGVDPPDVYKPSHCCKMECWIDPYTFHSPSKAIESIGKNLINQYEFWQPKARFKTLCDPTIEEIIKLFTVLKKSINGNEAMKDRILFHYNGHGTPKPTSNGELWAFNKSFTQYIPLSIFEVQNLIGGINSPMIYVFDCSSAGTLVQSFKSYVEQKKWEANLFLNINNSQREDKRELEIHSDILMLGAVDKDQNLPCYPDLPADLFTACLTTPVEMAIRWYILFQRPPLNSLSVEEGLRIPGRLNDRKSPLGELNWILTALTDSIAWNTLPRDVFQRCFRQDVLIAGLFRNFYLAERIFRSLGGLKFNPGLHLNPLMNTNLVVSGGRVHRPNHLLTLPLTGLSTPNLTNFSPSSITTTATTTTPPIPSQPVFSRSPGIHSISNTISTLEESALCPVSYPALVPAWNHPNWDIWDWVLETTLSQVPGLLKGEFEYLPSTFFVDQLTSFEIYLYKTHQSRNFSTKFTYESPESLPNILQVLLAPQYRQRALGDLAYFFDLGELAVQDALFVGVFAYLLKLLQSQSNECKPILVYLWKSLLGFDTSLKSDLLKEESFKFFLCAYQDMSLVSNRFKKSDDMGTELNPKEVVVDIDKERSKKLAAMSNASSCAINVDIHKIPPFNPSSIYLQISENPKSKGQQLNSHKLKKFLLDNMLSCVVVILNVFILDHPFGRESLIKNNIMETIRRYIETFKRPIPIQACSMTDSRDFSDDSISFKAKSIIEGEQQTDDPYLIIWTLFLLAHILLQAPTIQEKEHIIEHYLGFEKFFILTTLHKLLDDSIADIRATIVYFYGILLKILNENSDPHQKTEKSSGGGGSMDTMFSSPISTPTEFYAPPMNTNATSISNMGMRPTSPSSVLKSPLSTLSSIIEKDESSWSLLPFKQQLTGELLSKVLLMMNDASTTVRLEYITCISGWIAGLDELLVVEVLHSLWQEEKYNTNAKNKKIFPVMDHHQISIEARMFLLSAIKSLLILSMDAFSRVSELACIVIDGLVTKLICLITSEESDEAHEDEAGPPFTVTGASFSYNYTFPRVKNSQTFPKQTSSDKDVGRVYENSIHSAHSTPTLLGSKDNSHFGKNGVVKSGLYEWLNEKYTNETSTVNLLFDKNETTCSMIQKAKNQDKMIRETLDWEHNHSELCKFDKLILTIQANYHHSNSNTGGLNLLQSAFHPDLPWLVILDDMNYISVYHIEKATKLSMFHHLSLGSQLQSCHIINDDCVSTYEGHKESDNSLLLVSCKDGTVKIWKDYSTSSPDCITAWKALNCSSRTPSSSVVTCWQSSTNLLIIGGGGHRTPLSSPSKSLLCHYKMIKFWDLVSEQCIKEIQSKTLANLTVLAEHSAHPNILLTGYTDGVVRLYDSRQNDSLIASFREHENASIVNIIWKYAGNDPNQYLSGASNGIVKLWDLRFNKEPSSSFTSTSSSGMSRNNLNHSPTSNKKNFSCESKVLMTLNVLQPSHRTLATSHTSSTTPQTSVMSAMVSHDQISLLAVAIPQSQMKLYLYNNLGLAQNPSVRKEDISGRSNSLLYEAQSRSLAHQNGLDVNAESEMKELYLAPPVHTNIKTFESTSYGFTPFSLQSKYTHHPIHHLTFHKSKLLLAATSSSTVSIFSVKDK